MINKLGTFYVVTKPSGFSELVDILFKADIKSLFNRIRGGLQESEIVLVTTDHTEAKQKALYLLDNQKRIRQVRALAEQEITDIINGKDF